MGTGSIAACPSCATLFRLVVPIQRREEDGAVHVVDTDGSRRLVEEAATPPPARAGREEAAWSLQRWWSDVVRGRLLAEGKSKDRISQYDTYVRRWEQCCLNHWTAYPVVGEISPATLADYRTYLVERLQVTARAADKHAKGISALLQRAADDWIIARVPRLRATSPSGKRAATKWIFCPSDLDALYAACEGVQWPSQFSDGKPCENAGDYWRLFLVAAWNFGFRLQEWWSYESGPQPITWGGIAWGHEIQVEGRAATSSNGWATWTATKTGHTLQLPLHTALRAHLERIWAALPVKRRRPKRRIFDFPFSAGTAKPGRETTPADGWYAAWWDLVQRAGLQPETNATGRHLTYLPNQFRKTAHTAHRDNVVQVDGRAVRVGDAADFVTGHAGGKNVSLRHYYRSIGIVIATCESLRQPASFG